MQHLTPKETAAFLESHPDAVFIDCRSEWEFLFVGHPIGSLLIAWYEGENWDLNPRFLGEVRIAASHNRPVVLICRSGNRSREAGEFLERHGFTDVYNVLYGFEGELDEHHRRSTKNGWRFDGLPLGAVLSDIRHGVVLDPETTLPPERLLALCGLANLPALCADVYEVGQVSPADVGAAEQRAEISCVWGVFDTRRTAVRNGVRYELLSCPNALQWTVTTRNGQTTLHGSVNQMAPDPEFAETLRDFLDAFRRGLLAADRG